MACRYFVAFLLLSLLQAVASRKPLSDPFPRCDDCVLADVHDAPGIGFDLGISYGTSAIHAFDSTPVGVAKIPVSAEYISFFKKISERSRVPYESEFERWQKWIRKKLGLPSTYNVGLLSAVIKELAEMTRSSLPNATNIDKIVVTAPYLPALTAEDLNEAIQYAGFESWLNLPTDIYPDQLSEARAINAANGHGLCKNYKNLDQCRMEEYTMSTQRVLTIIYTDEALYLSLDQIRSSFTPASTREMQELNYRLGLNHELDDNDAEEHWLTIQETIEDFIRYANGPIDQFSLAGDEIGHPRFQDILRNLSAELSNTVRCLPDDFSWHILHDWYEWDGNEDPADNDPKNCWNVTKPWSISTYNETHSKDGWPHDPVFAGAIGAAMYARRRQEAPWNCAERRGDTCDKVRDCQRRYQQTQLLVEVQPKRDLYVVEGEMDVESIAQELK